MIYPRSNSSPNTNRWRECYLFLCLLTLSLFTPTLSADFLVDASQDEPPSLSLTPDQERISLAPSQLQQCSTLRSITQPSPFSLEPCYFIKLTEQKEQHHHLSPKTIWVKFSLYNPNNTPVDYWLTTGDAHTEQVRVWLDNEDTPQDIGAKTPLTQRQLPNLTPTVAIRLLPQEKRVIMIGYASNTYINTQIDLWKPHIYQQHQMQQQVYHAMIMGGLLFAIIISLTIYLFLRQMSYLLLTFMLLFASIQHLAVTDFLREFFWLNSCSFYLTFLSSSLFLFAFFFLFTRSFLESLPKERSESAVFWLKMSLFILLFISVLNTLLTTLGISFITAQTELLSLTPLGTIPLILFFILSQKRWLNQEVQQRQQENDAKSQFLREVNHEIRAPLNRVLTHALDIEKPSLREKIVQNCRHVILTIDEALSYSNNMKAINKADQCVLSWQDFTNLLEQSGREIVENTYQTHRNEFIFRTHCMCYPFIMIDDRRLLQVIDNLITNAARYTQRGKIKITLQKCHPTQKPSRLNSIQEKKEDYSLITLVIRDTGMGISAEEQLKIFNPLVRGSAGIKSGCKGAGMGLAIVKQVLEQLDGDIQLISEENKGTEITLHIPIYPASSDHYQSFRTENKNLTTPNAPQMKQLNNLIQQGAISDIIRWANQLNQQETLYENFTKAIILAATKGDMNGLRQLARNSDKEN